MCELRRSGLPTKDGPRRSSANREPLRLKERRWPRPQTVTEGNSMRGLFPSFSHPSPILLVGLLVLSTHLWAQRTSPLAKIPIQFLDTPAPFARGSDAQTRLHLT